MQNEGEKILNLLLQRETLKSEWGRQFLIYLKL